MHILLLSKDFREGENISEHTRDYAEFLARQDNDVCLVVSEENSNMDIEGVNLHEVPLHFEADNIYNWAMMLNTEIEREGMKIFNQNEFDAVHSQGWLTAPAGIKLSKQTDNPFFITLHSTENQRGFGADFSELISSLEWEACYEADKVFTNSEEAISSLKHDLDVPEDKIVSFESFEEIKNQYPVEVEV